MKQNCGCSFNAADFSAASFKDTKHEGYLIPIKKCSSIDLVDGSSEHE